MKRTIIIGDVHGCFDELQDLLSLIKYQSQTDRLIFVGDLINKGPRSLDTLKWVRSEQAEVVTGNHELGFVKWVKSQQGSPDLVSSGFSKLADEMADQLEDWIQWIESWPLYIEEDDFIVVHAGLGPGHALHSTPAQILATIRTWDGTGRDLKNPKNPPWYELYTDPKLVVFGHWALKGIVERKNAIGLDSGCVYGKKLTCLLLPERKLVSVPARKTYCPIR